MNNCILMVQVASDPQLRYTPDNQTEIAEMMVEFPGLRSEDPSNRIKVIGWGNFAKEMQGSYRAGDRVVIEGRLRMSSIEREGYKEKRAELTAARIHRTDGQDHAAVAFSAPAPAADALPAPPVNDFVAPAPAPEEPTSDPNLDDIPF